MAVKSAERTLAILDLFARERRALTARTVQTALGYPASSTIGLLKTLMRSGLADMEARLAMQTLRRFAIGAAMQEQSNTGASADAGIVATGDEGFEFGLQTFIDGLRMRIAQRNDLAKSVKRARN